MLVLYLAYSPTINVASYADYAPIVDGCRILMNQIPKK